jgi:hypothetical protein
MRRLKLFIASLAVLLCLVPAASASAQIYRPFEDACPRANSSAVCQADGTDPITGKNGILYKTSRILATVAAIGAVIMIMVGGFVYITSGGDASKASNGRRMIIGAVVGLAVIALAELFVVIVINLVS